MTDDPIELPVDGTAGKSPADSLIRAQKARLGWVLGGAGLYLCNFAVVVAYHQIGILDAVHAINYGLVVALINGLYLALVFSGVNLRFQDASLAGPMIFTSVWPSIYVMYFLDNAQARMAFLLMAMVVLLAGAMTLHLTRLLRLGGMVLLAYLGLLAALARWAPQRLDLQLETVIVFAYAVAIALICYLGSFIAGMRESLRGRNRDLKSMMVELEELATRDPLTRLPNRHSLMQQLKLEQARAERRRAPAHGLGLCLMDVDRFKQINDSFGHAAGDAVLRRIGEILQQSLRQGDFTGRFGGEEFLLILPETSADGARQGAERIRAAIGAADMPGLPADLHVTLSIGVAMHQSGDSIEATLARADQALYRAKDLGRNRVSVDGT